MSGALDTGAGHAQLKPIPDASTSCEPDDGTNGFDGARYPRAVGAALRRALVLSSPSGWTMRLSSSRSSGVRVTASMRSPRST